MAATGYRRASVCCDGRDSGCRADQRSCNHWGNPIYLTSEVSFRRGDKLTFEVLEQDASQLKSLVGKFELFGLNSRAFFAQLVTLERCQSTVPPLAMMRDRPTMRGILEIYPAPSWETEH